MTETKEQSLAPSRWCCQRTRATTLAEWRGLNGRCGRGNGDWFAFFKGTSDSLKPGRNDGAQVKSGGTLHAGLGLEIHRILWSMADAVDVPMRQTEREQV